MIFTARLYFATMSGRPGGRQTKSKFYEPVNFEVLELSPEDAPLATRTRAGSTRWFDGRHFASMTNVDNLTIQEINEAMEWDYVYGLTNGYECFAQQNRATQFPPTGETADEAPRRVALEMAAECFGRIIMVDNRLWVECDEPYLVFDHVQGEEIASLDKPSRKHAERPYHRSHSRLYHSHVKRADDPDAYRHIEVLIPESIKREPERDTIIDAATFLVEDYSYTYLIGVHPEIMAALTEVHRLIHGRSNAEIDCDALADPILRLVDAIDRHESDPRLAAPGRTDQYRQCVSRWLDRPFGATDVIASPPPSP